MQRRDFLKSTGLAALFMASTGFTSWSAPKSGAPQDLFKRDVLWKYYGDKDVKSLNHKKEYRCQVLVVGGGVAGICAAVSAARHGCDTILIQNRPVLGGNASSEVHVPINGSYHFKNKFKVDRETGIVEELQLANKYYNEQNSWSVWDHVLYDFVTREKNIRLMLNTQALKAVTNKGKIVQAICFQNSTESEIKINADIFIDCSGDGALAASAGAEYRSGREGKAEFNEKYAPSEPDGWVMGDSIQFSSKDMGHPIKFIPPSFAIKYDPTKLKGRKIQTLSCGFWWVELGSDLDIVADTETNRHKLLAYLYGAWDYVKNSGKYPEAANLALDWVGSLPGRRESKRFMGDYILNENDLTKYTHFDDTIAYGGGWSLDEHCPGGILNHNDPPSFFHQNFTQMFEIPYRCIYSKNISNLLFAGRNISVSHIALSATRLIAICGIIGQAAGTAASMCINHKILPSDVYNHRINELQEMLMRDDSFLPHRPSKDNDNLARKAVIETSATSSGDVNMLIDGYNRDEIDALHHWATTDSNPYIVLNWDKEQKISCLELKCDTNLHTEIELHPNKDKMAKMIQGFPKEMIKQISLEYKQGNEWEKIEQIDDNICRIIRFNFDTISTKAIRVNLLKTYGATETKVFEIRCYK